jgi:putative flavoprotein involved in K+ transport
VAEHVDTVVVGGGQAGLAVGHCLTRLGCEHVIVEQGQIADSWRTQRWDSFKLNTPSFFLQLPGHAYSGGDPEGYLTRDETVAYLDDYAAVTGSPIRTGVNVTSISRADDGGLAVGTSAGPLHARNVVVAAGSFRRPRPRDSAPLDGVHELHSSEYRNPEQLPDGGVLVVGSAQSGCQIAADLRQAGRDVYLSVGRCPSVPQYYRGRQTAHWLVDTGLLDDTTDALPSPEARFAGNVTVSGDAESHLRGPRRLARDGVHLLGRVESIRDGVARIAPDLAQRLAESDEFVARLKERIDELIRSEALGLPEEEPEDAPPPPPGVAELDLRAAGIGTVLWANGFRPDFTWIRLPVLDELGLPVTVNGASTTEPGLYFAGLHWLTKRKSALLLGVGEDAERVADAIAQR